MINWNTILELDEKVRKDETVTTGQFVKNAKVDSTKDELKVMKWTRECYNLLTKTIFEFQGWNIDINYTTWQPVLPDDVFKFDGKVMTVNTDWEYMQACITVHAHALAYWAKQEGKTDEELKKTIFTSLIHEFLHIVLAELRDDEDNDHLDKHEERVVTNLTHVIYNAITHTYPEGEKK